MHVLEKEAPPSSEKILARPKAFVCVYLLVEKDNQTLLALRKNTGFQDGKYGLVSGHVEEGESALTGMIREAEEEISVKISQDALHFVHCMHRVDPKHNRLNIDLYYTCSSYKGDIQNSEPEKCESLEFFSLEELPENTVPYVRQALLHIAQGSAYSEFGWD